MQGALNTVTKFIIIMQTFKIGGSYNYGHYMNMTRQVNLGVVKASSKKEANAIAKKAMEEHASGQPFATAVNYHYAVLDGRKPS